MTHPLTPREKVEREVLDAVFSGFEHGQCEKEWEPDYGKEITSKATDAILTALASGSGDHAELVRLADDLKKFEHHAVGSLKIDMGEVRRIIAVCDVHIAILAENAALRAERDGMVEEVSRSQARLHAATEAERKLAEAVGHVEQLVDRLHSIRDSSIVLIAARTFLSKEAERG